MSGKVAVVVVLDLMTGDCRDVTMTVISRSSRFANDSFHIQTADFLMHLPSYNCVEQSLGEHLVSR